MTSSTRRLTQTVIAFWDEVWNAHDPDAVDRFVEDDIIVEIGGRKVFGKDNFKDWIRDFLEGVNELHVDAIETFQNEDATRVTSRWYLTGTNNGIFGGKADQHPVAMTGISIWQVDEDGKLARGWIEQASHELYQRLIVK